MTRKLGGLMSPRIISTVPPRSRAHARSISGDQSDMLRSLTVALGKQAVAGIFGRDVRTIERWLKAGVNLKLDEEKRLRNAFQPFAMIEEIDGPHVARAWFIGMNPYLNDDTPIDRLSSGDYRSVLAAARDHVAAG